MVTTHPTTTSSAISITGSDVDGAHDLDACLADGRIDG
jgi:hypothetical protein